MENGRYLHNYFFVLVVCFLVVKLFEEIKYKQSERLKNSGKYIIIYILLMLYIS